MMKKTALSILLLVLFCNITHAGVVDLQFQNMNSEAYASADTQGGLNEMTDPHNAYASSYWEDIPEPPMIFTAHAQADISYSEGSGPTQSIESLLSGNIDGGMGYSVSRTSFSAELIIGTTQDIPTGTPLELLINITTSSIDDLPNLNLNVSKSGEIFEWTQFIDYSTFIAVNAGDELSIAMLNDIDWTAYGPYNSDMQITFEVVPEPCTLLLLGLGGLVLRKRIH